MELFMTDFYLKNRNLLRNEASVVWVILGFILLLALIAYAFYCTSRGYDFACNVGWPKFWQTGITCYK